MKTVAELIGTPEAQKYLAYVTDNRPVRRGHVKFLADLMRRGEFTMTHQGIAFDVKGNLIDGQHRLLAIIESGKTVSMQVSRGLSSKDYRNIDSGLARTMGDRLKLLSDAMANQVACSIVRVYMMVSTENKRSTKFSVDAIDTCFLSMDDAFTDVAMRWKQRKNGLSRSDVGAAIACYASKHPVEAGLFMNEYMVGEGLRRYDPAFALREGILSRGLRASQVEMYWKAIFVTQRHFAGEQVKTIVPATSDWQGNRYDSRLHESSRRAMKAAVTRRAGTLTRKTEEMMRATAIAQARSANGRVSE